jgi:hypothetical protein
MLDIFGGCILERAIHDLPPRRPALARDLATKAAAARSIQKAAPQTFLTRGIIIIIIIQSIDRSIDGKKRPQNEEVRADEAASEPERCQAAIASTGDKSAQKSIQDERKRAENQAHRSGRVEHVQRTQRGD